MPPNSASKRKQEALEDYDNKRSLKKIKKTKPVMKPTVKKVIKWQTMGRPRQGSWYESRSILFEFEPGKRYAHTASSTYFITMAVLQPSDKILPYCSCSKMIKSNRKFVENEDRVTLIVEHDLKEHVLCILDRKKLNQCKLDLRIQSGEQIAFRTVGDIPLQLMGHTTMV